MRILIVDDDPEILDLLESYFKSLGHQVTTLMNSIDAIAKVTISTFDIAFLDIVMPEKDGISLMKDLKNLDTKLPIVIITGYKDADRVIEAYRNGAIDCLLKPFNFEYIRDAILAQIIVRNAY